MSERRTGLIGGWFFWLATAGTAAYVANVLWVIYVLW